MNLLLRQLAVSKLSIAAATASLLAGSALADVIHVPGDASTIQAGIDLALPGDIVRVGDGVWTGPGNRDLVLPRFDMTLESAGGALDCIIDSQGTVAEPHRALTLSGDRSRDTVVRGFTFTGGETEVGAILDEYNGGGVLIQGGSPTISECRFINNHCACWGGAICISGADSPRITQCYFEGNVSGDEGGAVFGWSNTLGDMLIDNSVFIRNAAGNAGGAIFTFDSLSLDHVTIVENLAGNRVGGVRLNDGAITNSIIWGNMAPEVPGLQSWNTVVSFSVTQVPQNGLGNLQIDPLFRADGWHLRRAMSPCIDAGDPLQRPGIDAVDVDGDARRSGFWVDMGADEAKIVDRMPR